MTPPPRPVVPGSIGVLGGTFDPIHVAHLAVAEEAREAVGLERILFVPAGLPPHKPDRPISPAHHRLAMVEAAIAGNPAFAVSRIEVDRAGPSYAVDTLEILAAQERADGREPDLTFILSVEALRVVPSWREPSRILALCRMAVVPRGGARAPDRAWLEEHLPGQADRVTFLDGPQIRLSASEVRERVAAGRSIRYLVQPPVAAYIAAHHLYESEPRRNNRP